MRHEDELVALVADNPAYPIMLERLDEEFDRRARVLTQQILLAEGPVDQRMVDHERGFIAGAQWFLREIAKKNHQLMAELEEELEEEVSV